MPELLLVAGRAPAGREQQRPAQLQEQQLQLESILSSKPIATTSKQCSEKTRKSRVV